MLEYQDGSSDITQSIEASVTVAPYTTRPGPLIALQALGEINRALTAVLPPRPRV